MVEQKKATDQFMATKYNGQIAFEAYIAVNGNGGNHVILASPTLDKLEKVWTDFCVTGLEKERVQHVLIIRHPTDKKVGSK